MSIVLSEHLPLLATAPGGVQKLRSLILELALRGKLVPQNPNDEPASELLQRIARERSRLEVEGVCKKSKPISPVLEDDRPFKIPNSWAWVRWNDIAQKIGDIDHKMPETVKDGLPYVSPRDFYPDNRIDFHGAKKISRDDFLRLSAKIRPEIGDIIYPRYGTIGENRLVVDDLEFLASYSCCVIKTLNSFVDPKYQFYFSISQCCRDQAKAAENKTTQANVGIKSIQEFAIPLPPFAEQYRIAAKVDELMALCDQLETEQADAEAAHARLVDTLLGTLTQSISADDFAANWQRLAEHFESLFTTERSLASLKQTILQLAVMGKLVPQDPKDEPTSDLLKRIMPMRARIKAEGSRKMAAAMPFIDHNGLPNGWEVATLPELCEVRGGATPSKAKSVYWGEGLPWVSPKDMKVEHIFDAQDHVTEQALSETRLPRIPSGSLLIVVRGMILLHSFPVATTQVEVAINQDMKSLTPLIPELQPYLALALKGWKQQILALVDRSTHGTCKLQSEKLFAFQLGIPPLAEQYRIVAKVNELMALCERLKADLAESRCRQERLTSTLIESTLKAA